MAAATTRILFAAGLIAGAAAQGPVLVLNTCMANSSAFQKWTYGTSGSNTKAIFLASNACIDIEGFDTNPGAEVYTWPCGSDGAGANEVWDVTGAQIKSGQTPATCLCATGATVYSTITTCACNTNDPLQSLQWSSSTGNIVHTASGLCVDGGTAPPPFCQRPPQSGWTLCNPNAAIDDRSADIVSRLTVADKIQALGTATPGLPSVGMGPHQWWSEATHGISGPGVSHSAALPGASNTALPITTSCSFNRTMWKWVP